MIAAQRQMGSDRSQLSYAINKKGWVGLITCLQNTYSINSSTSTSRECVKMNLRHGDGRAEGATNKKRRGDKFEVRLTLGKGRNNG